MSRRMLALWVGVSLAASGIAPARPALAGDSAVSVAAIPVYILSLIALGRGCTSSDSAESEFGRDGAYLGVGGAYGIESFDLSRGVENSGGVYAHAGYRCHPRVAAEIQGEYYPKFNADTPPIAPEVDLWDATANTRVYLFTGRIQPYLLSGIGLMQVHSDQGVTMRLGAGIDYYATPQVVLTVGMAYLAPFDAVAEFDLLTVGAGAAYRF